MVPDIIIAAFVAFVVGMIVGAIIYYYTGEPKCRHEFEEILRVDDGGKHIVVHMCNECGKRKITKV